MARPARSILLDTKLETDPRGRWRNWDRDADGDDELAERVAAFEPLDHPAGVEAARWLQKDALDNDGQSKTRLLVSEDRVEGFIATSFGTIELTEGGMKRLPVRRDLRRREVGAFLVCWVARHRESEIPGSQLMLTAVALARRAKRIAGLMALAVDPHDDEVAAMWRGAPWHLQQCRKRKDGRQTRLYVPI